MVDPSPSASAIDAVLAALERLAGDLRRRAEENRTPTAAPRRRWAADWGRRPSYLSRVRRLIGELGLDGVVRFVGTVGDEERERLFHAAHILAVPSYHEGFCRPVVEGLRAGCVPLVYDAYNLPHIAARLGRTTPPGDVPALAAALADLARAVPGALARRPSRTWGCGGWAPASLGQDHAAAERWARLSSRRSA